MHVDIFFIVLSIRDLTFKNGENSLQMNIQCTNCGDQQTVDISREILNGLNLDEIIEKYFDENNKCYYLRTQNCGNFPIYLPTVGVASFLKNAFRFKLNNNKFIDPFFLKFGQFLFDDWRHLTEKVAQSVETETAGWSGKKISLMNDIYKLLAGAVDPTIHIDCQKCGHEVVQELRFQQGQYASLFLYANALSELI